VEDSRTKSGIRAISRSVIRSLASTNLFRRKKMWIWPAISAVVLVVVGVTFRNMVEQQMKRTISANLHTILRADVEALRLWLDSQEANATVVATDDEIVPVINRLAHLAAEDTSNASTLLQSNELRELRTELEPFLNAHGYNGFAVMRQSPSGTMQVIASDRDEIVGKPDYPMPDDTRKKLFTDKQPIVSRPSPSVVLLEDRTGELRAGVPTMFAAAPVRVTVEDGQPSPGQVAIGLRIRPDVDFTRILSVARSGMTGETYAFDRNGRMLSNSLFEGQLKELGLLVDSDEVTAVLTLDLRDPQTDLTRGERPPMRRSDMPLTRMAFDAITMTDEPPNEAGLEVHFDVDGYRDYRGVPVVGAWTWLNDYDFGVASEIDVAEAYGPVYILRYAFWTLFGLLALGSLATFAFTVVVARLNREAQRAAVRAQKLGQYSLEEKIGAGGMGEVYRARHAMLHRPTAVKLLHPDKATTASIARFEREVQMTSQLCHPNTIEIYDYGRTPEGVFYYAMEFLDGMTLDALVREAGPQPEGRVIHILRQVCGSLNEAHGTGLIHRDIKPANIVLNKRGGQYDVVKLLDFGLVKAVDSRKEIEATSPNMLAGTPMYLPPEAIERPDSVDARSDLYAVGAVGYFLLTGKPVFEGKTIMEVCTQHVRSQPVLPSQRAGRSISGDLEEMILRCLAKSPDDRPQSAKELSELLSNCSAAESWTAANAEAWWTSRFVAPEEFEFVSGKFAAQNAQTVIVDQDDTSD
jgi:hypothetical protein